MGLGGSRNPLSVATSAASGPKLKALLHSAFSGVEASLLHCSFAVSYTHLTLPTIYSV